MAAGPVAAASDRAVSWRVCTARPRGPLPRRPPAWLPRLLGSPTFASGRVLVSAMILAIAVVMERRCRQA